MGNETESERWVVLVARNNLDLLKQSVASAQAQDVPVRVLVVDNGSAGDVGSWLRCRRDVMSIAFMPQHSVSRAWNAALSFLFGTRRCERVLVINQDSVLRPDTYRWLESERAEFVTGVGSDDSASVQPSISIDDKYPERIGRSGGPYTRPDNDDFRDMVQWSATLAHPTPRPDATRPHPDFSCFMISRECYERVGPFDERFLGAFAEDGDYHVRMHKAGIRAYAIDLPFWHIGGGSQTVKRADPVERDRICAQADENRAKFKAKWGFEIGSKEYYRFFGTSEPPSTPANAE